MWNKTHKSHTGALPVPVSGPPVTLGCQETRAVMRQNGSRRAVLELG